MYDERKVAGARRVALANPRTQFILYYPEGSEPPDLHYDNVDFKQTPFVMDGRFLMHDKIIQLTDQR